METDVNPYRSRISEFPDRILWNSLEAPSIGAVSAVRNIQSRYLQTVVELGSGSGGHILQRASQEPNTVFYGFELRFKRAFRTIEKALQHGLENVFTLRTTAENLSEFFPPLSLSGLYMNFPDPWDKRRWKKYRMMSNEFLNSAYELLVPNGFLSFKTDHQGYFQDTLELFQGNESKFRVTKKSDDLHNSIWKNGIILTEFERLFVFQGKPIHFLEVEKI